MDFSRLLDWDVCVHILLDLITEIGLNFLLSQLNADLAS